jgi:cell division protease FtsH
MITKDKYRFILEKKTLISTISKTLKEEFIGLDNIIDEIVTLVSPWIFFPEVQLRPTIINLWGLTGTGKTALVKRLVELLDMKNRFLHLDMGEYAGESGTWIRTMLTEELEHFHDKPSILCFDEFQFARTLDSNDNELSRDKMRVLWEIFDSGKIYYEPSGSGIYLKRAEAAIQRVQKCVRKGIVLNHGEITGNVDEFNAIFSGYYFDVYDRYGADMGSGYFLSKDFIEGIKELFSETDLADNEIQDRVKDMTLEEIAEWLFKGIQKQLAVKQLDLSKALIFILGNLDEAFYMSHELRPDLNADEFHEETLKINIADIKSALQKRFRNEQIARLGNNHLIYPCFNSAGYKLLIRRHLERINAYVKEMIGSVLDFDYSVVQVIYDEGVFPSQGARPVLTTIKQLVESYISVVLCRIVEKDLTSGIIEWSFAGSNHLITFRDMDGKVVDKLTISPRLKLYELRKSDNDDIQAHIAVHESGHAIVAALTLRILPSIVVTKTVSSVCDGFCRVNYPERLLTKEVIRKRIMIALAGFVAEKLIFGEENTSTGVDHDLERASELANRAIKEYGMGSDPIRIHVEASENNDLFFTSEKYVSEALKLIEVCLSDTQKLLERNKLLLLKMSQYLTENSVMREKAIGEVIRYYGVEPWLKRGSFISKEQYYSFKEMLQKQVDDLENQTEKKLPEIPEYAIMKV